VLAHNDRGWSAESPLNAGLTPTIETEP